MNVVLQDLTPWLPESIDVTTPSNPTQEDFKPFGELLGAGITAFLPTGAGKGSGLLAGVQELKGWSAITKEVGAIEVGVKGANTLTVEGKTTAATNAIQVGKKIEYVQGVQNVTSTADRFGITFSENPRIFAFGDMVDGQLSISVRTYAQDSAGNSIRGNGFSGSAAYDQIFNNFGDRITSVSNSYIADNAVEFNVAIAKGSTLEQAAMKTWDGQQMLSRGFSNVTVKVNLVPGGGYADIKTVWTK